jgi:hypothetical protein
VPETLNGAGRDSFQVSDSTENESSSVSVNASA